MLPGGAAIRARIYSWPETNPCRVDQATVSSGFDDVEGQPLNARGLDALDYILFVDTDDNACPSNLEINTSGAWDQLRAGDLEQARAKHAAAIAASIAKAAPRSGRCLVARQGRLRPASSGCQAPARCRFTLTSASR